MNIFTYLPGLTSLGIAAVLAGCTSYGYIVPRVEVDEMGKLPENVNWEEAKCMADIAKAANNDAIQQRFGQTHEIVKVRDTDNKNVFRSGFFNRYYVLKPRSGITQPAGCPAARIIAIPGTEISFLRDWWINLSADPKWSQQVELDVHPGFMSSAIKLRNDLRQRNAVDAAKPIYIVGHSKGGAISVALYLLLASEAKKDSAVTKGGITVYTFGQPKVAVLAWEEHGERIWRFVRHNDPVPLVPPQSAEGRAGPYRHFSQEIYLWGDHRWSYLPAEKARIQWGGRALWRSDVEQHYIDKYVDAIEDILKNCPPMRPKNPACLVPFDGAKLKPLEFEQVPEEMVGG